MLHSFEEEGNEVGLHIHWGSWQVTSKIKKDFKKGVKLCKSRSKSLRSFTQNEIKGELEYYLELMHELGFSPHSFRGGGLCQTSDCLKVLAEHGFKVDSSVAPGLNEKGAWHQNHIHVPYDRGYYYPSKARYDLSARNEEERIGILEVPVTRQRISSGSWSSILTAKSFMQVYNWAVLHQKINPKVITFICHNWEIKKFSFNLLRQSIKSSLLSLNYLGSHWKFISVLEKILNYLEMEGVHFAIMKELKHRLLL